MAGSIVVDAGFLIALLIRAARHDAWAVERASQFLPSWKTGDAVLPEAFRSRKLHFLNPLIRVDTRKPNR